MNESKLDTIRDIHELPDINKYPKALKFFTNVYMRQDYQDIIPTLEDLVTGDEVSIPKVQVAMEFLEKRLK